MNYIAALALLVAVMAWLVGEYMRLEHLKKRVEGAWSQWNHATRRRNERLGDFVTVLASYIPKEDQLAREMRRWVTDSGRALDALHGAPIQGSGTRLSEAEQRLQVMMSSSGRAVETNAEMRASVHLQELYQAVAVSHLMQSAETQHYNRLVHDYNAALETPMTRLLAPVLGFSALEEIRQGRRFP